jgi:hypothetical protein
MTLRQVMQNRALELLQLAASLDTILHILWSGGIDTTASITVFLQMTENYPEYRSRMVIRYAGERSILEYPLFFDIIRREVAHREIQGHVRDILSEPDVQIVVTGDPMDMMTGTFKMAEACKTYDYSLTDNWAVVFPRLLHRS